MKLLFAPLAVSVLMLTCAGCNPHHSEVSGDHSAPDHHRDLGTTTTAQPSTAALCSVHGAPQTLCFICDPQLRDPERLWCAGHQRYEDRCWLCHPDERDANRPFCDEHGLYEDECFFCQPKLKPVLASRSSFPPNETLICREHDVPEAECGICHPETVAQLQPGQGTKVRLPSTNSAHLTGISTARPEPETVEDSITCLAEVVFNQNQMSRIVAPVGGILESVDVDLGTQVTNSQPLARLWSAQIAEAVAKAFLTHQTLERERRLHADRVTPEKDLQAAQAEHRAACQQLRTLGFTEDQIDELGHRPGEPVLLTVSAPFAGEIVERNAVRGSLVEPGTTLFTVADRSTMWADLRLPESALHLVKLHQRVQLSVDTLPNRLFHGRLTWISAAIDERTRMAQARAQFDNPDGILLDRMFARAQIFVSPAEPTLVIPSTALHRVNGVPLVFVQLSDDLYEARAVRLGTASNGRQSIKAGLLAADHVVTEQGFAVKSQLLISRLGAGCAHE